MTDAPGFDTSPAPGLPVQPLGAHDVSKGLCMALPPETSEHQLFRAELHGDTLVVTPRGDAVGFTAQAVSMEQNAITELASRETVKHLVVDLGTANYFGSIVLGSLIQLGNLVQSRRGRVALASASDDMQDVLRLMKLDRMWEFFPTCKVALREIARIPIAERIWDQRRKFVTMLVIAAGVALFVYFPRVDYGRRYYVEASKLWREALAKRRIVGDEEWERFLLRADNKIQPMLQHMLKRSKDGKGTTAELFLIYTLRDQWKPAMDRKKTDSEIHLRMLQHWLRCAEAATEDRPVPIMAFDAPIEENPLPASTQ